MRFQLQPNEIAVDNFAGGGGASTGIEEAIGRPCEIAVNHDPAAIAMHKANHPETRHFCENILEIDPREACGSRPVGLAWFSPDCRHFSRAKGGKPVEKKIRALAWVAVRWAKAVRPRVIVLENVEEFQTWGPLRKDGRPDRRSIGRTFREWVGELTALGYNVEWRSLVAADYGAPTTRRRLFIVARRDGGAIVWPDETHGEGRAEPWRTASEIIDWTIPCPSIFERRKPLAEATLRRIAKGIERYVVNAASPFVIPVTHQGDTRVHGLDEPLRTVTAANRGELALVSPFVVRHGHYSTITGAGLREGCGAGTFRGQSLERPLATVCATNDKHIVVPLVTKHYGGPHGGAIGHDVRQPLGSVTARDSNALTTAFLTKFYGTSTGSPMASPVPTVTANDRGGGHLAEVRAFLIRYYGQSAAGSLRAPLPTITSCIHDAIVTVHGSQYRIVDIGMRMLQPCELFRAQGFPDGYVIRPTYNGKPMTKTAQIRLAGNSVCPPVARELVANQAA